MSAPVLKKTPTMNSLARRTGIVLTDDDQLRTFANTPDEKFVPKVANTAMASTSLSEICQRAVKGKSQVLTFFHDHFFGGGERELHLTHPEFIDCTRKISEYAEKLGIGIGASVTNPLDLGRNFKDDIGVGGQHRFYAEGVIGDDGSFAFDGVLSERWCNNKGYIYPQYDHARVFAYTEDDTDEKYLVIRPESIIELEASDYSCTVVNEPWELSRYFGNRHMRVEGKTSVKGNRAFAVFYMDTPEMDYFHPKVTEYVHGIIDMYREQGVEFMELYSDEMHIQFDWNFAHFGPHEIPTRYMTENFQNELVKKDSIFADFDKALVYMGYDMQCDRESLGRGHTQHVMGIDSASLYRTFEMRRTYFEMLQDKVVGMCCEARDYIRATYVKNAGWDPLCLGHATWQESPTCDMYAPGLMFHRATQNGYCTYDYSKDYVYSSTIREAISGCYDYFKWNDYFSYGGNDFCECGWFDRNYYGGAMAASLGALNRNEVASWGAWGFPNESRARFNCVSLGFGATRGGVNGIMNWDRPRTVDVLYLYPKYLTSVEERFGSWMVQCGYVNYCPSDRVVNLGKVEDGVLRLGLGRYTTVVAGFEPFYDDKLMDIFEQLTAQGGRVIWNSTPPADAEGNIPQRWLDMFGLASAENLVQGGSAAKITFCGTLEFVHPMLVPTDMLPDRVYEITPADGTEVVAYAGKKIIGARKNNAYYIGCRLRDDQSGESGDAPKTLFEVLKQSGAYGGKNCGDNTETISRDSRYFATKFGNGTVSLTNHYYPMKELWEGGFGRSAEKDAESLRDYKYMVPMELSLHDFAIEGHRISFGGHSLVQFRLDENGGLIGYRGCGSTGITIDGKEYKVTENPADTAFNTLDPDCVPDGYTMGWRIFSNAEKVDICTEIPAGAEIYRNDDVDGCLTEDEALTIEGSTVIKPGARCVVVLVK